MTSLYDMHGLEVHRVRTFRASPVCMSGEANADHQLNTVVVKSHNGHFHTEVEDYWLTFVEYCLTTTTTTCMRLPNLDHERYMYINVQSVACVTICPSP